jgi:hypothetical protein
VLLGAAALALDEPGELVAAEPRHQPGTGARRQAPGDRDQHLVARRVAEHVIDLLEAIDVEDDRDQRAPIGVRDQLGSALVERAPVGEPGQGVMAGGMPLDGELRAQPRGFLL